MTTPSRSAVPEVVHPNSGAGCTLEGSVLKGPILECVRAGPRQLPWISLKFLIICQLCPDRSSVILLKRLDHNFRTPGGMHYGDCDAYCMLPARVSRYSQW